MSSKEVSSTFVNNSPSRLNSPKNVQEKFSLKPEIDENLISKGLILENSNLLEDIKLSNMKSLGTNVKMKIIDSRNLYYKKSTNISDQTSLKEQEDFYKESEKYYQRIYGFPMK